MPLYATLFWFLEGTHSVRSLSTIKKPRKELVEYAVGDRVEASFAGGVYPAIILRIGDDKANLEASADDLIKNYKDGPGRSEKTATQDRVDKKETSSAKSLVPVCRINDEQGRSEETSTQDRVEKKKASCVKSSVPVSRLTDNQGTSEETANQERHDKKEASSVETSVPVSKITDEQGGTSQNNLTSPSRLCIDITEKKKTKYCHCSHVSDLRRTISRLEEENATMKKDILFLKSLTGGGPRQSFSTPERPQTRPEPSTVTPLNERSNCNAEESSITVASLTQTVVNKQSVVDIVQSLARAVFSVDELKGHSFSGKRTVMCRGESRPALPQEKLGMLIEAAQSKGIDKATFTAKFTNFQKFLRQKK